MRYGLLVLLLVLQCGCESLLRSRYAMDDPYYAGKYAEGAERGDLLGKAKQALDARHTAGLGGLYLSGGACVRPSEEKAMAGGELGGEYYVTNWFTPRAALAGFGNGEDGFIGLDLGARLQTPSRIAPFVGVGTFLGYSDEEVSADDDWQDNDVDGWVDEWGETEKDITGLLGAVYPEVGVHLWLDEKWRITTHGRYTISTEGRDRDDWLLGVQIALFSRGVAP
jgi:hypothetical protein